MEIGLLISAIGLGLGVSLHCVGMCGPIALSLGITGSGTRSHLQNLLYQLGRASTYALLGMFIGLFTEAMQILVYQDYISISSGLIIILMALFPFIANKWLAQNNFLNKIIAPIKIRLSQKIQQRSLAARYFTGFFNGFLPCGPVYIALAAAMGTGSWWQGSLFMFLFGVGTLPLMYAMVFLGNKMQQRLRNKLYKALPFITISIGLFFILRGLHLNIPFLSPPKDKMEEKIELIDSQSRLTVQSAINYC